MTEALPLSPTAIAEWIPFAKAAGFFLATFVLEDVAAVGAGLLLATGGISWSSAFVACFLGIWMGDAGLYALARYAGRGWFERSSLRRFAVKVAESERWFAQRGTGILIFSRLVPGARLPTYLAAGFLRVPLPRFLFVTGVASCVWTLAILWLAQTFGARLTHWLGTYQHAGVLLLGAGVLLLVVLQVLRRALARFDGRRFATWLGRWRRWEFWPAWMFYPPVAIYCLWLALKYRGLALPTTANPGIFSGGLVGESKSALLQGLFATSPKFTAEAALLPAGTFAERVKWLSEAIRRAQPNDSERDSGLPRFFLEVDGKLFHPPFILKPDLGQRGAGIKLIRTPGQVEAYLRQTDAPLIVQRYAPGPHEIGVFYYRFPHEAHGHIFAITEKIFPSVTGDGRSTVAELIRKDTRARFAADTYLKRFESRRDEVLAPGEELKLVEAGNHAQGCVFRDGSRLRTPELAARIDEISRQLSGFFIGRYDLRYASETDLRAGVNFQIVELNGAASEATNIYDARNSIFAAYRTLFRQWDLVFAIGAANRRRGYAPTHPALVWRKWREYSRLAATYPTAD
jgi:membrane protein DedA with SNARE-associated domain